MIAYFDTSAIVPLVIAEAGSVVAERLWDDADRATSTCLIYPEARAALAQARRLGRLTGGQLRRAVRELDAVYDELDVIEIDADLARDAGELSEAHGLRGYDAVHLAAVHRVADDELVVVAGDRALLDAAGNAGFTTARVA